MPLLEMESVSKVYRLGRGRFGAARRPMGAEALTSVSIGIGAAESVGLVGESGAGKSTLAMLAAGIIEPTSGRIALDIPGAGGARHERRLGRARGVQLVWQDAPGSFDPRQRIGKAVAEPLKIHGLARGELKQTIDRLLGEVGLDSGYGQRYPHELSGGQLQRAAIARALALDPLLLICDEPASSLDARHKLRVAELLTQLRRRRGLALLVVAHDLALVKKMTDRVYVMYRGRIVEAGPTVAVLTEPRHPYTRLLVNADPASPEWSERIAGASAAGLDGNGDGWLCAFASRCAERDDACRSWEPLLAAAGSGREVSCPGKA